MICASCKNVPTDYENGRYDHETNVYRLKAHYCDSNDCFCGGPHWPPDKEHPRGLPIPSTLPASAAATLEPMPEPNDNPAIVDLVIDDMRARKAAGITKYKTPLQAFNGRDSTNDAYQEALDLVFYVRQWREERRHIIEKLKSLQREYDRWLQCGSDVEASNGIVIHIGAEIGDLLSELDAR